VFTRLLDFVGLYGLLLMPVGAIVFVEHWIFPRIGLTQYWISQRQDWMRWVNLPGLIAWGISLSAAVIVWLTGVLHLFFLIIPVWLATAILYIILSYLFGAAEKRRELPDESGTVESNITGSEGAGELTKKSRMCYISGTVAVTSLLLCFCMAVWVAASAGDIYKQRLMFFKIALVLITSTYFVFGATWLFLKEKTAHQKEQSEA
jgi:NCS1 family nucleobase:cation symporter-1